MNDMKATTRRLLSAKDLQEMGFSRSTAYNLLNRADLPVVRIGGRKYLHAGLFDRWLENQARCHDVETPEN